MLVQIVKCLNVSIHRIIVGFAVTLIVIKDNYFTKLDNPCPQLITVTIAIMFLVLRCAVGAILDITVVDSPVRITPISMVTATSYQVGMHIQVLLLIISCRLINIQVNLTVPLRICHYFRQASFISSNNTSNGGTSTVPWQPLPETLQECANGLLVEQHMAELERAAGQRRTCAAFARVQNVHVDDPTTKTRRLKMAMTCLVSSGDIKIASGSKL